MLLFFAKINLLSICPNTYEFYSEPFWFWTSQQNKNRKLEIIWKNSYIMGQIDKSILVDKNLYHQFSVKLLLLRSWRPDFFLIWHGHVKHYKWFVY